VGYDAGYAKAVERLREEAVRWLRKSEIRRYDSNKLHIRLRCRGDDANTFADMLEKEICDG